MHCSLCAGTPADLETVLRWLPDTQACRLWAGPGVRFPASAASLWIDIEADGKNAFALHDPSEKIPVGFGQLLPRESGTAHLARLIISPLHRGQGLGRQLCSALMRHGIDALGAQEFTLRVYPDNKAAVALYRSLGFTEEADATEESGSLFMRARKT